MNRKHIQEDMTAENGGYAVKSSRKRDIVAAVICLVLAMVVWLFVMNVDDTADVGLSLAGGSAIHLHPVGRQP